MTNSKKKKVAGDSNFSLSQLHVPVIVCDYHLGILRYVNEQFLQVTGLSAEECFGMSVKDFNKWVHESDLELFENQVIEILREICDKHITDKSDLLSYSYNYRLKTKDGDFLHVLMQSTVTSWDKNLFPKTTVSILTDLTDHKKDHKIILSIKLYNKTEQSWQTILIEEFLREPQMLANREKKIMQLMMEDKSATEIADMLTMNPFTVRTHWRNILHKTGCNTQKKLKELALTEGWI